MSDKQSSSAFVRGFLAGAAAAAVYTLLKVPRSGHETIDQIKGQGSKLKTRAGEKVDGLMHHAEQTPTGWQDFAPGGPQYWQADLQDTGQRAQSAAEDVAQEAQEQAAEVVDTAQAEFTDAAQTVQAGVDGMAETVKDSLSS